VGRAIDASLLEDATLQAEANRAKAP
jgi:hypothetical protein